MEFLIENQNQLESTRCWDEFTCGAYGPCADYCAGVTCAGVSCSTPMLGCPGFYAEPE